jgi:hypothetical protein
VLVAWWATLRRGARFDGNLFVVARHVDGWPFWRALATYCETTDIPLERFVIDLRFDLLD